jgi:hypothetical protein
MHTRARGGIAGATSAGGSSADDSSAGVARLTLRSACVWCVRACMDACFSSSAYTLSRTRTWRRSPASTSTRSRKRSWCLDTQSQSLPPRRRRRRRRSCTAVLGHASHGSSFCFDPASLHLCASVLPCAASLCGNRRLARCVCGPTATPVMGCCEARAMLPPPPGSMPIRCSCPTARGACPSACRASRRARKALHHTDAHAHAHTCTHIHTCIHIHTCTHTCTLLRMMCH